MQSIKVKIFNKILPNFIYLIIFFKIIFYFCLVFHVFFKTLGKHSKYKEYDDTLIHLISQSEFIFKFLMAILIIFIFYPWRNNMKYIDRKIQILFYLFGFILLFTADWNSFLKESVFYKNVLDSWK